MSGSSTNHHPDSSQLSGAPFRYLRRKMSGSLSTPQPRMTPKSRPKSKPTPARRVIRSVPSTKKKAESTPSSSLPNTPTHAFSIQPRNTNANRNTNGGVNNVSDSPRRVLRTNPTKSQKRRLIEETEREVHGVLSDLDNDIDVGRRTQKQNSQDTGESELEGGVERDDMVSMQPRDTKLSPGTKTKHQATLAPMLKEPEVLLNWRESLHNATTEIFRRYPLKPIRQRMVKMRVGQKDIDTASPAPGDIDPANVDIGADVQRSRTATSGTKLGPKTPTTLAPQHHLLAQHQNQQHQPVDCPLSGTITVSRSAKMPRHPAFFIDLMVANAAYTAKTLEFKQMCVDNMVARAKGEVEVPTLTPVSAHLDGQNEIERPLPLWRVSADGREQVWTAQMLRPGQPLPGATEGGKWHVFRIGLPGQGDRPGGEGGKAHWDLLLEDVRVMHYDFRDERREKIAMANWAARWCWWAQGRRRKWRGELIGVGSGVGDLGEFVVARKVWDVDLDEDGVLRGFMPERKVVVGLGYKCRGAQLVGSQADEDDTADDDDDDETVADDGTSRGEAVLHMGKLDVAEDGIDSRQVTAQNSKGPMTPAATIFRTIRYVTPEPPEISPLSDWDYLADQQRSSSA